MKYVKVVGVIVKGVVDEMESVGKSENVVGEVRLKFLSFWVLFSDILVIVVFER